MAGAQQRQKNCSSPRGLLRARKRKSLRTEVPTGSDAHLLPRPHHHDGHQHYPPRPTMEQAGTRGRPSGPRSVLCDAGRTSVRSLCPLVHVHASFPRSNISRHHPPLCCTLMLSSLDDCRQKPFDARAPLPPNVPPLTCQSVGPRAWQLRGLLFSRTTRSTGARNCEAATPGRQGEGPPMLAVEKGVACPPGNESLFPRSAASGPRASSGRASERCSRSLVVRVGRGARWLVAGRARASLRVMGRCPFGPRPLLSRGLG